MSDTPDLRLPPEDAPVTRRGRLLVASPVLRDPNFARAVVLMLEHSADGALGLVLNRPLDLRVHDAVPSPLCDLMDEDAVIHGGGPVQPEALIVLADHLLPEEAATLVVGTVGIIDPRSAAEDMPQMLRRARAFGGYAGWSDGQLEGEIAEGAWIDVEAEPDDVFTDDHEGLWGRVVARKGGGYRIVAQMPDDPTLN